MYVCSFLPSPGCSFGWPQYTPAKEMLTLVEYKAGKLMKEHRRILVHTWSLKEWPPRRTGQGWIPHPGIRSCQLLDEDGQVLTYSNEAIGLWRIGEMGDAEQLYTVQLHRDSGLILPTAQTLQEDMSRLVFHMGNRRPTALNTGPGRPTT